MDQYPVFIDFGSLSFHEAPPPWDEDEVMSNIQDHSVRGALSLGSGESQLWCEFDLYRFASLPNRYSSLVQSSQVEFIAVYLRLVIL